MEAGDLDAEVAQLRMAVAALISQLTDSIAPAGAAYADLSLLLAVQVDPGSYSEESGSISVAPVSPVSSLSGEEALDRAMLTNDNRQGKAR